MIWHQDFLPNFESLDLVLDDAAAAPGEPADSPLVATLVRRIPDSTANRRAVLYVHGWNDYFFQTHLADEFAALGYDFYAIDLRRYGRSLRKGQLNGFITSLEDYAVELDLAAEVIAADHDQLLVMGHSTGGLIASLWVSQRPELVAGLILNSPWLDLQGSAMVRAIGAPVVEALGSSLPTTVLRLPDPGHYKRAMHVSGEGEWDYDLDLKRSPSPPVRVGWLRAILQGHQRVAAGLGIKVPVLVMCSTTTAFRRQWDDELRRVDTVLDVEQIAARAPRLGRHVTIVRIEDGVHDLMLSAPHARAQALAELGRWVRAYQPEAVAVEAAT